MLYSMLFIEALHFCLKDSINVKNMYHLVDTFNFTNKEFHCIVFHYFHTFDAGTQFSASGDENELHLRK